MQIVQTREGGHPAAHLDLVEGVEQRVLLAKLEDDLNDTAARGGWTFVSVFTVI